MDDIVIAGISGRLPESNNLEEFWENLINGVDMVTEDDRRWTPGLYGLPKRNGKLKDISHFDAAFFGVHPKQAHTMDPQLRLMLEIAYESIVDAGLNPATLRGSKTGVYIGVSGSEAGEAFSRDPEELLGYSMTGCQRAMLANRLSYFFDFSGLYGLPKRNGKLKDISHFDAAFFGVHPKQAHTMDPQLRLMLEIAYESIVDAERADYLSEAT